MAFVNLAVGQEFLRHVVLGIARILIDDLYFAVSVGTGRGAVFVACQHINDILALPLLMQTVVLIDLNVI